MEQCLTSIDKLLERRISLLRELADSVERAQAAVLTSDQRQVSTHTRRQQQLCDELRRLSSELPQDELSTSDRHSDVVLSLQPIPALPDARQSELSTELRAIENRLANLTRTYSALLRRAQRTVNIFCRVLLTSGATYVLPASQTAARMRNWRE